MTERRLPSPGLVRLRTLLAGLAVLSIALGLALRAAPPATASVSQISIVQDDDQLVYATEATQRATLYRLATLGVNWVRATVLWSAVASRTQNPAKHRRFDPTNPRSYPHGSFANLDRLVRIAQGVGITVYFNITGPGPAWAMGKGAPSAKLARTWRPSASQFGRFVQAVGTRYSGCYPNGCVNGAPRPGNLPRIFAWSIWNEPNWPGWLAPQAVYDRTLRKVVPYAPVMYRNLFYAARRGLDASGHRSDFVMLGETQPLGVTPNTGEFGQLRPGLFLRETVCLNSRLRPFTGAEARARGCTGRFTPLRISAYAHHPYTKAAPPSFVDPSPDSITLGNIAVLPRLLDRIAAASKRLPAKLPVLITEMGYSTNPPNPYRGVTADKQLGTANSLETQAAYINESDYLAYKQPRVISMTQFEYRDSPPVAGTKRGSRAYWASFQTGITFRNGTPKPSYAAYLLPFWARAGTDSHGGRRYELWAQVRFRRFATPQDAVVFQYEPPRSSTWAPVAGPFRIDTSFGFVDTTVSAPPYAAGGRFRAVWLGPVVPNIAVSRTALIR